MKAIRPFDQRREALAPLIARLYPEVRQNHPTGIPECISFGEKALTLDPWEHEILQEAAASGGLDAEPWARMLAEGVAFQIKCLVQLDRLTGTGESEPPSPEAEQLIEQTITDAAVGLALLQESQRVIDELKSCGERLPAKKLTGFRRKIDEGVAQLREQIGTDAFERAENKSKGMMSPSDPVLEEIRLRNLSRLLRRDAPSHVRTLLIGLAVLCTVWAVLIMPRFFEPEALILQSRDFSHIYGIQQVMVRTPSLFVNVDDDAWNTMPREERLEVIETVRDIAEPMGYTGAQLRHADGTTAGQWLKNTGARLAD